LAYKSQHRLRNGSILVYARSQGLQHIYQARLKIPDTAGYVVRSLKTQNLNEALQKAEDLFDELRFARKQGIDVKVGQLRFKSLWKRFYETHEAGFSIHRQKLHKGFANRYFLPFLGEYKVNDLPDVTIEKYWEFRIHCNEPKNITAKHLPSNVVPRPSQKTLAMEGVMLRQIFRWGKRMGFVQREPSQSINIEVLGEF
jgi:hypothetical protein